MENSEKKSLKNSLKKKNCRRTITGARCVIFIYSFRANIVNLLSICCCCCNVYRCMLLPCSSDITSRFMLYKCVFVCVCVFFCQRRQKLSLRCITANNKVEQQLQQIKKKQRRGKTRIKPPQPPMQLCIDRCAIMMAINAILIIIKITLFACAALTRIRMTTPQCNFMRFSIFFRFFLSFFAA